VIEIVLIAKIEKRRLPVLIARIHQVSRIIRDVPAPRAVGGAGRNCTERVEDFMNE